MFPYATQAPACKIGNDAPLIKPGKPHPPVFLGHSPVNADGWECLLYQQLRESYTLLHRLDKDDYLNAKERYVE